MQQRTEAITNSWTNFNSNRLNLKMKLAIILYYWYKKVDYILYWWVCVSFMAFFMFWIDLYVFFDNMIYVLKNSKSTEPLSAVRPDRTKFKAFDYNFVFTLQSLNILLNSTKYKYHPMSKIFFWVIRYNLLSSFLRLYAKL